MGWARVSNLSEPRPGPEAQSNKLRPRRVRPGRLSSSGAAHQLPPIMSSQLAPALPDRESTTCHNAPSLTVTCIHSLLCKYPRVDKLLASARGRSSRRLYPVLGLVWLLTSPGGQHPNNRNGSSERTRRICLLLYCPESLHVMYRANWLCVWGTSKVCT